MPLARFALYESRRRDLPRVDRGRRRRVAADARPHRTRVAGVRRLRSASSAPAPTRTTSRSRRLTTRRRPRRLGDPRAGRRLPRRAALRRGGHPLRRARPGRPLGRAAAVRSGGPLPPPRRAGAHGHAATGEHGRVVGAGVFGASIARELALRGWDVTLVEQYSPGHRRSASGGDTRLLRLSHGDRSGTRRARCALERWLELEAATGTRIWEPVGIAWFARRDDVRGSERPARAPRDRRRVARRPRTRARLPVARRRRSPRGALRAGRRRAERAARDAAARRRRRAPRRALQGRPTPARRRPPGDVVVWACGAWLPKLFPELVEDRISRRDVFFFGVDAPGTAHRGSATTTAGSTATATSTGSA